MLRVRLVQTNRHHLMERELSGNYEYDEADAIYGQVPERMSIITTTSARVPVFCKALSSSQPEMLGPEQLFSALESIGMDAAHLGHSSSDVFGLSRFSDHLTTTTINLIVLDRNYCRGRVI